MGTITWPTVKMGWFQPERNGRLYTPDVLAEDRALVIVLHGGFGGASQAADQTQFDKAADAHGFLALYPEGIGKAWNAGLCCGVPKRTRVDDTKFVTALVDSVGPGGRVYATGLSNGAMMAYRLACETDWLAGIAPVAGTLAVDASPKVPTALLHIHGLADQNIPFEGGTPTRDLNPETVTYPPVFDGLKRFVIPFEDSLVEREGKVVRQKWSGPTHKVELVTIDDGLHSWPGGVRYGQKVSKAIDATEEIVRFFGLD